MTGVHERRRFLKLLGAAGLGMPLVDVARAQQLGEPTLFLELNLRVQMDLMHVMVPPSIAKYASRVVGAGGDQLTMFAPQSELKEYPNNVFLTNDSLELAPHIDSVAMLDTGEAAIGGVHGLEAGNGMRSPGRVMDQGASGLLPMWLDDGDHGAWNEELYGNVPTPATLHNFLQKQLSPELLNGYAFKGFAHPRHSCYHFSADLAGAELTRIHSKPELMNRFGAAYAEAPRPEPVAPALPALPPYLKRGGPGELALAAAFADLRALEPTLELSPAEVAYFSEGIPPQRCSAGEALVLDCSANEANAGADGEFTKAQIWEQFAHAGKLLRSGLVRSVALEFDYGHLDGDGVRTESVLRESAQQVARPLARFIAQMKAAGLYDRTLVAVYLVDGSRRPSANSSGGDGKGTVLLAGGKVKGGYYGDILIQSDLPIGRGHTYAFRAPNPATGALLPAVSQWADGTKRTPSGSIWRTVAKAAGIPENEYVGKFSQLVDDALPLDFMLKL